MLHNDMQEELRAGESIEVDAQRSPSLYKLKLLLLALLGYAYIFFVLIALLLVVALLLWSILLGKGLNSFVIQLEIALIVLMSILVRSLWVQLPAPQGLTLVKDQAPELFEAVHEIRRAVDGPPVDKVLLTEEFNASVVPIPRLGLFGWPRNYLLIGLPLMHTLSPAQFRAVLAHELGHLAGAHGHFSSWIYRIRSTWFQLMWRLEGRRQWGSLLFNRFFRWYVPFFSTYSFVLARRHEYEADLCAAKTATAQTTAEALMRCAVFHSFLNEKFWREIHELVRSQSSPPAVYTEMPRSLRDVQADDAQRWLEQALAMDTSGNDSHPSLKDRLAALGQESRLPAQIVESAADFYLADALDALTEQLNNTYQARLGADWLEDHQDLQSARQELHELNLRATQSDLTADEAYRRACLIEELENSESALPSYREVLQINADHAAAHFAIGKILLSENQDEGIRFLERAMNLNEDYVYSGSHYLHYYLTHKRDTVDSDDVIAAQRYLRRAAKQSQIRENAQAERSQVSFLDHFVSHDLSDEEIENLRRELAKDARVREAYLVRKEVEYLPEKPLYALGVVVDRPWYQQLRRDLSFTRQFAYELDTRQFASELKTPLELYSFELDNQNKRLKTIIRNVSNSLIYQRS